MVYCNGMLYNPSMPPVTRVNNLPNPLEALPYDEPVSEACGHDVAFYEGWNRSEMEANNE